MQRFSLVLFLFVISTPLVGQSTFNQRSAMDIIAVTKYCAIVENPADSQLPRIFARTTSAYGQSTGWAEFDSRAAWSRAGSPKTVAAVWYRDAKIVRVTISSNDDEDSRVYADYCYRPDDTLARLRLVPSEWQRCEPSRNKCVSVLREARFYPPEGPILKTYGLDAFPNVDAINGLMEAPPAKDVVQPFVPMNWPEYYMSQTCPSVVCFYLTSEITR